MCVWCFLVVFFLWFFFFSQPIFFCSYLVEFHLNTQILTSLGNKIWLHGPYLPPFTHAFLHSLSNEFIEHLLRAIPHIVG